MLPSDVVNASCLLMFKSDLDCALNNVLRLLISPGGVRQLNSAILEGSFQLTIPFCLYPMTG